MHLEKGAPGKMADSLHDHLGCILHETPRKNSRSPYLRNEHFSVNSADQSPHDVSSHNDKYTETLKGFSKLSNDERKKTYLLFLDCF